MSAKTDRQPVSGAAQWLEQTKQPSKCLHPCPTAHNPVQHWMATSGLAAVIQQIKRSKQQCIAGT
jgi:hypothetical protein